MIADDLDTLDTQQLRDALRAARAEASFNRISRVRDDNLYDIRYEYDAMGNRRLVDSSYWDGAAGLRDRQTDWYAYDAQSRVLVSEGCFSGTNTTNNTKTNAGTVKSPAATRLWAPASEHLADLDGSCAQQQPHRPPSGCIHPCPSRPSSAS